MLSSAPGLHVADYVVFAAMLLVSLGIGVYYSLSGGRQRTTEEYLMGNRQMSVLPVTLSYTVSFISTILLLGYPAEIYSFGSEIVFGHVGFLIAIILAVLIFVPVLYPLKMTSVNEYFTLRFKSQLVRGLACVCTLCSCILYASNVYFGPSTAIEAVTGFPAWISITLASVVSVCYTTIGGFKAVIWTDVFQSLIMLLGLLALVIQGTIRTGGLRVVFNINQEWGRLNFFDWDWSLYNRISTWNVVINRTCLFLYYCGTNQASFQRYSAMPTKAKANKVVLGANIGMVPLSLLSFFTGWIVFAYYTLEGCDPVKGGHLTNPNQVVPLFVMEVFHAPGVPGLFLAACTAASLSSASSALNAASAVTWEDILKPLFFKNTSQERAATIAKITVLFYGIIATAIGISFVGLGGTVVQIMTTFSGSFEGIFLGVMGLGLFMPWINWKGALSGSVIGVIFGLWVSFGSYTIQKHLEVLPTTTTNCLLNGTVGNGSYVTATSDVTTTYFLLNGTSYDEPNRHGIPSWLHSLYSISYMWILPMVFVIVIIIANVVSLLAGGVQDMKALDHRTLHPVVKRYCCLHPEDYEPAVDVQEGEILSTDTKSKEKVAVSNL